MSDLRALLAAATPGPWHSWHGDDALCMNAYGITSEPCDHEMTDDEGHPAHVVALTLLQEPRLIDIHAPDSIDGVGWIRDTSSWRWVENRDLIVAAVNALPAILDVVDAARELVRLGNQPGWDDDEMEAAYTAAEAALARLGDPR